VYFNHAVHVNKGVGCTSCHGQIDQMQLVRQQGSLLMEWCLECHRAPEKQLRPLDQVFNSEWTIPANQLQCGQELKEKLDVKSMIHCSTCHR
jgi:hypothetical protein